MGATHHLSDKGAVEGAGLRVSVEAAEYRGKDVVAVLVTHWARRAERGGHHFNDLAVGLHLRLELGDLRSLDARERVEADELTGCGGLPRED